MKEKKIGKDLFIISVITTITIAVWIAIDVYRVLNKSEVPPAARKQIEPLDPKLDTDVLDQLEQRGFYDFSATETMETLTPPSADQP